MSLKRVNGEIRCEFCGTLFRQTRWWQVFCSKQCKESSSATAKNEVRDLRMEVKKLRQKIKELENNAGTHSGGRKRLGFDDEPMSVFEED